MKIDFFKYHGSGNDFIMIDLFKSKDQIEMFDTEVIKAMCTRHFGIGADGLIILAPSEDHDFKMIYFNSDGRTSSMCGNGGRCIVKFANDRGYTGKKVSFEAIDGIHHAEIIDELVVLDMNDVQAIKKIGDDFVMDTGSPHFVTFTSDIHQLDIKLEAHKIRYNEPYAAEGINVNFVERQKEKIMTRTYERGVEDETLSCGTGAVACALACHLQYGGGFNEVSLHTRGGLLKIKFQPKGNSYTKIQLIGPAQSLFEGCYKYEIINFTG